MAHTCSQHEKLPLSSYSEQELWNLVQLPSFASCASEDVWRCPSLYSNGPSKNIWGDPIVMSFSFSYSAKPDIDNSLPLITSVPFTSCATENIRYPPTPSNDIFGWYFPPQGTQLSDNSSAGASKPDEDINALVCDEHVGGSSVNVYAGTMNITSDGEFNQPPGDVESFKPLGDSIPFSDSQDGWRAHDSSTSTCYVCGEAEHFARKCSLGKLHGQLASLDI